MNTKELHQSCQNLWLIAHSAYESLRMWEAIAIHASALNQKGRHIHFWGSCQRLAMSHAIVDICKLFRDSKDPKEETLYRLKKIAGLEVVLPSAKVKNSPLERIFRYRDKILVHKEIVSEETYEENKSLPSLEDFYALVGLAKDICCSTGYEPPLASVSLRNATKNVMFRVLQAPPISEFRPGSEYSDFMRKGLEEQ